MDRRRPPEDDHDQDAALRLPRRDFLAAGIGAVGAATLTGAGGYLVEQARGSPSAPSNPADLRDWNEVRRLFDLRPGVVHLTTFLLAAHPRPVRDAIASFRRALDADPVLYLRENEGRLEDEVRRAAARYLGAAPDEVALTDSTTMGLGLVYSGLRLERGDEVLTTEHDFYATHETLRVAVARSAASLRKVRLYDEPERASVDRIVQTIVKSIGPRTRYLAVTWVHSSSGVKLPLEELADALAEVNRNRDERTRVLLCVDGVHGFGCEARSPVALGCDLFVSGCHKWLFGPRGTGIAWGRGRAWRRVLPTIPSFDGRAYIAWLEGRPPTGVPPGPLMTPGGFHSFEHRWALAAAFELHRAIGRGRVAERTHSLASQLKAGLAEIRGVRVRTPRDERLSAGLVCFEVAGRDAGQVVDRLFREHRVIASVTPYRTGYVRLGPSIVNTPAEVDRALDAVARLA